MMQDEAVKKPYFADFIIFECKLFGGEIKLNFWLKNRLLWKKFCAIFVVVTSGWRNKLTSK